MPDLQPGPELDALVAEKVMGWKSRKSVGLATHEGDNLWIRPDNCAAGLRVYSTDISAAWEVVEKIKSIIKRNFFFELLYTPERPHWYAVFSSTKPERRYSADGRTAPHAICLAALKAFGAIDA